MIWVSTTPVFDDVHKIIPDFDIHRHDCDVIKYNEAADEIMKRENIRIIDLYSFAKKV